MLILVEQNQLKVTSYDIMMDIFYVKKFYKPTDPFTIQD